MLSFRRGTDLSCTRMFLRSSRPTPRTKHRRFLQVEPLEQRVVLSTYWVSPSGSDSNNGSATSPYATLQHSMMSLQPGDTLDVEPGTYAGFIVGWDSTPANSGDPYGTINGTAGNPITIQADPSAAPGSVIINSRNNETRYGIDIEPGCQHVVISGITINDSSSLITNSTAQGGGIKIGDGNNAVENCTISNIQLGFGIIADNASSVTLKGNTIFGVHNQGNGAYGHGIYLSGTNTGAVINGNTIYDNDSIGIHLNGDASEGGTGLITNALIENNLIYNNGQNGINADGLQGSTIENNLIYNYADYGICLYQIDAGGPSQNNVIVNNTIDSGTSTGTGGSIRILDGSTGNTILNNILLDGSSVVYRISADSQSGTVSNHNIVPNGAQVKSDDTGAEEPFSQWQSSTGQDHNSLTATPSQLFVNPSGNNYQLSSTSPAIGVGTSTDAPSTDILGNPRPSGNGYDIGAYVYQAGAQSPPPVTQSPPPVTQSPPPVTQSPPPVTQSPPPVTQSPPPVTQGSSIWSSSASPQNANENDNQPVEVGVRFSSDVDGYVTGLKFYKGSGNTGTHVGHLWDSAGNLLATATFTGETATGWQQVNFSTPVAITAGTTYVASYLAPNGHYADDQNYFTSQYNSGSLHVPANGGVYAYGGTGSFPTQVWNASNYWVDVVFSTQSQNATPTTAAAGPNATIWANTSVPTVASENDSSSVQVGVKFSSDVNGYITGLRFYKAMRQYWDARRQSLDQHGNITGDRHLHRRDRHGVAASELLDAGGDHGGHDLRRLVSGPERLLRRRPKLLHLAIQQRVTARASQRWGLRVRWCGLIPYPGLECEQLLGRCRLHYRLISDSTPVSHGLSISSFPDFGCSPP